MAGGRATVDHSVNPALIVAVRKRRPGWRSAAKGVALQRKGKRRERDRRRGGGYAGAQAVGRRRAAARAGPLPIPAPAGYIRAKWFHEHPAQTSTT